MNQLYFTGYDNKSKPNSDRAGGSISFPGQDISLVKTADGGMVRLGYSITLIPDLHISVSSISGEIGVVGKQSRRALGVAVDPRCYVINTGYKFPLGGVQSTIKGQLQLPLSLAALE